MPVQGFVYPKFISPFWDDKTGKARKWFPYNVVYRIETGEYPYLYGNLIHKQ
jgi:hypothetical protein